MRLVTVCVLDHGDDSILKLVDPGRAQDVAVPKEIRADWTNRELVRLHRLHVNHDVACVVARDDPRVLDRVEVGDHRQPPTPNVEFVLHGVRQDVDDCLLLVVDEDELVVVPAAGINFLEQQRDGSGSATSPPPPPQHVLHSDEKLTDLTVS